MQDEHEAMPHVFQMTFAVFPRTNCAWKNGQERVTLCKIAIELARDGLSYFGPVAVKKI